MDYSGSALLHLVVHGAADDALHVVQGVVGVDGGLVLGGLAHHAALRGEGHEGRSGARAHRVREHLGRQQKKTQAQVHM